MPEYLFTLECCLHYGTTVRMVFSSRKEAEAAQALVSAGMAKGKYQSDEIVHIVADTSTYDIRISEVMSVSVNDNRIWTLAEKQDRDHRESLGLPNKPA